MSGYLTGIYPDYAVSLLKPRLFGGSSGDYAEHDGRVVGHIELYAYALEITGKFCFRCFQFHGREIDRMGIQLTQGSSHSSIRQGLNIHRVHIVFLHLLKNEIELAPAVVVAVKGFFPVHESENYECRQHSDYCTEHS